MSQKVCKHCGLSIRPDGTPGTAMAAKDRMAYKRSKQVCKTCAEKYQWRMR